MIASYKGKEYEIPKHKWVVGNGGYSLLDEHGKAVGRVEPIGSGFRTFSGEREFAISETLDWAKAVVLMETFHPGSIGADAWY